MFGNREEVERMMEKQRIQGRILFERIKDLEKKFKDETLVEDASESAEVSIEARNRKLPTMLTIPKERKTLSAAIIILHDVQGVTSHIRLLSKRLALAGYVTAIPTINLRESDVSWQGLEPASEDLESVLNYLRNRPDIDRYLVGCLGFGVGGTLCLKLAAKSQYVRACFTLHADPPPMEKLQTKNMRALLNFQHSSEDLVELEHLKALEDARRRTFVTTGPNRNLNFGGGGVTDARHNYFDFESPNYDEKAANITQSNILLFFDQELLIDRSHLPENYGQIGIYFSRLSSTEKQQYFKRMHDDRKLAEEVGGSFFVSLYKQLDEDIAAFEELAKTNKGVAKGRASAIAANFSSYSPSEKQTFLTDLREKEESSGTFLERVIPTVLENGKNRFSNEERKRIFDLALSSSANMRSFAFGRGNNFSTLSEADRKNTLAFASETGLESFENHDPKEIPHNLKKEFRTGLALGITAHYLELSPEDQASVRRLFNENTEFAEGLMSSFYLAYQKAREEDMMKDFWKFAKIPKFGEMLGVSFGMGFGNVPHAERAIFLDFARQSREFARYFGFGAGIVSKRLSLGNQEVVKTLLEENPEFKMGYEEATRSALYPQ